MIAGFAKIVIILLCSAKILKALIWTANDSGLKIVSTQRGGGGIAPGD